MTILLILGAVAGLYMLWLLFRLASLSLPVYVAIGTGFALLRHEYSYPVAILAAFGAGVATLLIGQLLIAFIRSPLLRLGIALLFAIPAAFAGYQAAHSLGSLTTNSSSLLAIIGSIAAFATSASAWQSVMGGGDHNNASSADGRSLSSNPHPGGAIISD
jgi:hypothetical protein